MSAKVKLFDASVSIVEALVLAFAGQAAAKALGLVFLLTLCLTGGASAYDIESVTQDGHTFTRDSSLPEENFFVSEVTGYERFEIRRLKNGMANIDVYAKGKLLFSVPDIHVCIPSDGDYAPGESELDYMFYLSPRRDYLLVVRGLIHPDNVVYFYALKHRKMRLVTKNGLRLDEALINSYASSRHMRSAPLEQGNRVFTFCRWLPDGKGFAYNMSASSYLVGQKPLPPQAIFRSWSGDLDLRTLRMSKTQTLSTYLW
jgi:hypothetical protein